MLIFLALLGWNPGTEQEHFTVDELVKEFSIEKVNKSGARFDPEKLNGLIIITCKKTQFNFGTKLYESKPELDNIDINYLELVIEKVKERANFISDFDHLTHYFFEAPKKYDDKAFKKAIKPDTEGILRHVEAIIKAINDEYFETEYIQSQIKAWINNENIGFGKVMMPLRLALLVLFRVQMFLRLLF